MAMLAFRQNYVLVIKKEHLPPNTVHRLEVSSKNIYIQTTYIIVPQKLYKNIESIRLTSTDEVEPPNPDSPLLHATRQPR